LKALPFSAIYEILGHGSLTIDSEDGLYDFISKGIETRREMFPLLEFVRLEYCSTDVMNDFFHILSEHFYGINTSLWAGLRTRLVLPHGIRNWFPPSMKKVAVTSLVSSDRRPVELDLPDGITAHLTRECGGNVHDRHVIDVACGSFEKETAGDNPHSGAYNNQPMSAAKNAADLESDSCFNSAFRHSWEAIPHTRNNWICYDFKERRIVPTHYTIRTNGDGPGYSHLKSWLVETSVDGENWREVAHEEDNEQLNGRRFTATFTIAGGGKCRFIRLVQIGRNHYVRDDIFISAWEIFGNLIE
jgi:hypothetical protein